MGFDYGIVQLLEDARRRFLKPRGTLIPARIKPQLAAVESAKCHHLAEAWQAKNVPREFHWIRHHSLNAKHPVHLTRDELLGAPVTIGIIDLREGDPGFRSWDVELSIDRDGITHGLGGWFDCELAEGVSMTNSPLSMRPINRPQVFLPIDEPVEVKSGDVVRVKVMARSDGSVIVWEVAIPSAGRKFSHSTWHGELLTRATIRKRNPAHTPRPNREAQARMIVLSLCDGQRAVKQIEEAVVSQHPGLFPSAREISRFVSLVLERDTE